MLQTTRPEYSVLSQALVYTHTRLQLGRLTVPLHYNASIYKDMQGKRENIHFTFLANVIRSADISFFLNARLLVTNITLLKLSLGCSASFDLWKFETSPSCVLLWKCMSNQSLWGHLLCISLCCYDAAQLQRRTPVCFWNDTVEPGHFRGHCAFGLAPQPAAVHSQSALQWNLFMPLEKKWFFFFPWLHHKGGQEQWKHWVAAALNWDVLLKCTALLRGHAACCRVFSEWST